MKRLIAVLAGAFCLFATHATAQTTYYIQSAPYASVANFTACPPALSPPVGVGCSAVYTTSHRLAGSFTILGALGPNLVDEVVDVRLGDLDLDDGQNSFQTDFSGWSIVAQTAQVSTDAGGNLTFFEFKFDKINGLLPTAGNPNDPKSYVTSIYFANTPGGSYAYVRTNSLCTARGDNVGGNTLGLGCATESSNPVLGGSEAFASAVTMSLTPPTPPPAPVPTLTEWAMILLGLMLAGAAALMIQRRRTV